MLRALAQRRPLHLPLALACALLVLAVVSGCSSPRDAILELKGRTMGTSYSIKLAEPPSELDSVALQGRIDARLEQINARMSTYRPDSELSRFNASRSLDWFPVSRELAQLVAQAKAVHDLSGGAFDVTVGPAVDLWGFGPKPAPTEPPDATTIAAVRERIGSDKLEARLDPPALRKTRADLAVDLSAIAKGYGVDAVARLLDEAGIAHYLVEIGGELRARGHKPDANPWRIAIERPNPLAREVYRVVELRDAAMATSGDYRNFIQWGDRHYSHAIDPQTAQPVTHSLASVSVIAADCATADALATALLVLGPERGLALAEREGLAAFFVTRHGETHVDAESPAFTALSRTPD
ncbi:MAG: FAD:protein FMN transferase [Chromatiaceae bacterium]|nr:FAD:protein FMN transferase [Chromatiaceae bacterium]